ncbi:MAG: TatA/E family twin arginine-targeting protein translocase [Cyanobacteria bacterium REEB417]|nr:TatA/E family twin arginine-targeting protein translocase [Cyanobacteria bacterium REEB417]
MNVFGIGLPEMAVIAAIGLLVFGPRRLPELGKTLGRTLKGFQTASQDFEKEFRSAITADEASADGASAAETAAGPVPVLEQVAEPSVDAPAEGESTAA